MSTPATESSSTAPAASRWEDFVDILHAPATVYRRRRDAGFALVLLGLTLLLTLLFLGVQSVLGPVFEAELQRAMQRADASLPPEQLEQMRELSPVFGAIGFALTFPFMVLLTALVVWAIAKAFGSTITYATAALVATYAQIPVVFSQVSAILQGLALDVYSFQSQHGLSLGPARLLDVDTASPVLLALAQRFDLFTLWSAALLGIGIHVAGRLSRGPAFAAAALVWALGSLPHLLGQLLGA